MTTPQARPVAHKFGGTSVQNAERLAHVGRLLLERDDPSQIVVVSAMKGVTDALIGLVHAAARNAEEWPADLAALERRHLETVQALLGEREGGLATALRAEFTELTDILRAQGRIGAVSVDILALVSGLGEVWCARILTQWFRGNGHDAHFLDARDVLVVEADPLGMAVDWAASTARLDLWLASHPGKRAIATGFVARDVNGRAVTLGRNGSDYSGAIFGALFEASEIEIWTDVDGVLSADPRRVHEAVLLDSLSYAEACELAYFGAKVLHPQTMAPAVARGIPLVIRNTFNPAHPGTRIEAARSMVPPVKGLTTATGLALLNIEGTGMIGVPGTAERVFAALQRADVSVVMISQGSSEHSICCVVAGERADAALAALRRAFQHEMATSQIQDVNLERGIAVLAAVGEGMVGTPGVAARFFGALARAKVNVRAIAQGASERNISAAIAEVDATRALRAVHAGFYLSAQTLSVGVIGPGQVGRALLAQLAESAPRLRERARLDLRLRALAGSRRMRFSETGLPLERVSTLLEESSEPMSIERFAEHVRAEHLPHAVIIDCSASDEVAQHYAAWLARGIHVITPNKRAGSGPIERYRAVRAAETDGGTRFRYEATVGAGLPVMQTLRDLLDTGDELIAVEGTLSGTLAYLFHRYDGNRPFSELVREAAALGYTEPDPRDDLGGLDVARKLVILAREAGLDLALDQVEVESLVPDALAQVTREEFLARLEELDAALAARVAGARANGRVLRHVARVDAQGSARVAVVELDATHPFAVARATDNVVQFTTRRYRDNPLVVQGPGAGPEVTAAGVFADLLRLAASIGARL